MRYSLAILFLNERADIISKLHDYTGLSREYLDETNIRLSVGRYNKEPLRSEGRAVGRLDERITGLTTTGQEMNTNMIPVMILPSTVHTGQR